MTKKVITINESHLKEIVKDSLRKVLAEAYSLTDSEELMEYLWLRPKVTQLNVDLFVDDGKSYERHNHQPLLFARNGYDKSVNSFIPFAISDIPNILDTTIDYKITYNDIFAIQHFIVTNLNILKKLSDGEISHQAFMSSIRVPSYVVSEGKTVLLEMATLRMEDSNLPMDVWLDEGATYQRHAPRLKFRASFDQHTTREYSSMLLTNPPTIENMPKNSPLKAKDIKRLENFVINNLEELLKLANGEIDYTNEFLPNMKKDTTND